MATGENVADGSAFQVGDATCAAQALPRPLLASVKPGIASVRQEIRL